MKWTVVLFFPLLVFSCVPDTRLEQVLASSGNNRPELEKVLRHYEDDGQKYRAACFLIENIDLAFEVWKKYPWCRRLAETELTV